MSETHRRFAVATGHFTITGSATATAQLLRPLSDDHPCYAAVGMIAAETARIEFLLDQAIANAADLDRRRAACLTGQMVGPTPRFQALFQLCSERTVPNDILKRLNTLSGQCSGLFERRNRAVHDPWLEDADTGLPHQFRGKPKKNPDWGTQPVTEQQLRDDLTELRKLRDQVNDLVGSIWEALRPQ